MLYIAVLVTFFAYVDFVAVAELKNVKYETSVKRYLSTTSDFHTLVSRSITECAVLCEQVDKCMAFNFISNGSCELAQYSADGQPNEKVIWDGENIYIKHTEPRNNSAKSENSTNVDEDEPKNNSVKSDNSTIREEVEPQNDSAKSDNITVSKAVDPRNNSLKSENSTIVEEGKPRNNSEKSESNTNGKEGGDVCWSSVVKDGVCYFLSKQKEKWNIGRDNCRANGAELLCIKSKEENEALAEIIHYVSYWVGLNSFEGNEYTCNGENPQYTKPWVDKSYKSTPGCMYIYNTGVSVIWQTALCNSKLLYVCEKQI